MLYQALAVAGNEVTLCLIKGLGHGSLKRNYFDKGEPRLVIVRHTRNERPEHVAEGPAVNFNTIEAFSREHLCSSEEKMPVHPLGFEYRKEWN